MAVSGRVRMDDFTASAEAIGQDFMLDLVRGKWQIFEAWQEYNPTTGGHIRKGLVLRRWDPDAGDQEGKAGRWATKAEAEAYFARWVAPRERGRRAKADIDPDILREEDMVARDEAHAEEIDREREARQFEELHPERPR